MQVQKLAEGLWRWTAPHPAWKPGTGGPGGWEREVGCVYLEAEDAVVLFDPLVPPEGTDDARRFWEALDRDVGRAGLPVAVVVANRFHGRSAGAVRERYRSGPGASIHAHRDAVAALDDKVTHPFGPGDGSLPRGVTAHVARGLEDPEVIFHLPAHRALVVADALIGTGGGEVRVPPESWAAQTDEGRALYRRAYRDSLRPLLDLRAELLLVSHGEIVTVGGAAALVRALEAPAWGEDANR